MEVRMKKTKFLLLLGLAGLLMIAATVTVTESYSLNWWTADGGGGTSQGATYQFLGSAGQPEAGSTMAGGDFALSGGYLAGFASQPALSFPLFLPLVVRY
jgi:hypothetical protein